MRKGVRNITHTIVYLFSLPFLSSSSFFTSFSFSLVAWLAKRRLPGKKEQVHRLALVVAGIKKCATLTGSHWLLVWTCDFFQS